jgi:hypothetical protein
MRKTPEKQILYRVYATIASISTEKAVFAQKTCKLLFVRRSCGKGKENGCLVHINDDSMG